MKRTFLALSILMVLVAIVPVAVANPTLSADLSGAAVVGGGDPDGSGYVVINVSPASNRVCSGIVAKGIDFTGTTAALCKGAAGANGPVVMSLTPPTSDGVEAVGCFDLSADLIKDMRQHSEQYYVIVYNSEFPGGALRAQLGR